MPPAARMSDKVLQMGPHCHGTIHPAGPVTVAVPHPPVQLPIVTGSPTVMIGGLAAARVSDKTAPCVLPSCVPGGPALVQMGSATVKINSLPAARMGDATNHVTCTAPIPMPQGKILPPCCPTVIIGG